MDMRDFKAMNADKYNITHTTMEEEILKLLNNNNYPHPDMDDDELCAKEITSMVMEFFDWGSNTALRLRMPFDELFEYWINNIRKP